MITQGITIDKVSEYLVYANWTFFDYVAYTIFVTVIIGFIFTVGFLAGIYYEKTRN